MRFSKLVAVRDRLRAGVYDSPALSVWLADRLIEEMNMKHTPGTWKASEIYSLGLYVTSDKAGEPMVAKCDGISGVIGSQEELWAIAPNGIRFTSEFNIP